MTMSNTMICGATKIWYYIPEHKSAAFEAWLETTRPGYIESLEAGPERCHVMIVLLEDCLGIAVKLKTSCNSSSIFCCDMCGDVFMSLCLCNAWFAPQRLPTAYLSIHGNVVSACTQVPTVLSPLSRLKRRKG